MICCTILLISIAMSLNLSTCFRKNFVIMVLCDAFCFLLLFLLNQMNGILKIYSSYAVQRCIYVTYIIATTLDTHNFNRMNATIQRHKLGFDCWHHYYYCSKTDLFVPKLSRKLCLAFKCIRSIDWEKCIFVFANSINAIESCTIKKINFS